MQKFFSYVRSHKFISAIGLLIIVTCVLWATGVFAKSSATPRYVLATAQTGALITSVTGSGQVSASNQVELTAKASGDITSVAVVAGQEVKAGALIASIDAGDAAIELENARLSYDKLVTVDATDVRKAQNTLDDATESLADTYQSARTTLSTQSVALTDTVADIDALLSGYISPNRQGRSDTAKSYISLTNDQYYKSEDILKDFQKTYRAAGSLADEDDISALLADAERVAVSVANTAKSAKDTITYLREREEKSSSEAESAYTKVSSITTDANASLSAIRSAISNITKAKNALDDAQENLDDINAGADVLDVRQEQLSLKQKQEAYSDHFVRAPFDGVVASVDAKRGDTAGSGTAIATLITKDKIAEISLNEVDAAKVSLGNKVTLTFDAFEDLSIAGTVAEVDAIGTVSQGVVSYTVKITFDTDDARIKSGMSVTTSIVTDAKTDVLMVPTSAVKTGSQGSYVLVLDGVSAAYAGNQGVTSDVAPREVSVTVGTSNDTMTEILSGLSEGDTVVSRTVTSSSAATASSSSAPSIFGSSSGRGGAATTVRSTGAMSR